MRNRFMIDNRNLEIYVIQYLAKLVPYRLFSYIKNKKNNLRKALISAYGVLGHRI
jgi:hypothetical protein